MIFICSHLFLPTSGTKCNKGLSLGDQRSHFFLKNRTSWDDDHLINLFPHNPELGKIDGASMGCDQLMVGCYLAKELDGTYLLVIYDVPKVVCAVPAVCVPVCVIHS